MFERLGYRLTGSVLIWDVLLTLLCLYGASRIRLELELGKDLGLQHVQLPWQIYLSVGLIWVVIFLLLIPQRALFVSSLMEATGRLVAAVALANLSFAGLLYLSLRDVSRLQFIYFAIADLIVLLLFHLVVRSYLRFRHSNGWQRRVLLVGGGTTTHQLVQEFARRPWAGVRVVGYTSDQPAVDGSSVPCLGTVDATPQIIAESRIAEVIFTLPPQQQEQIVRLSLQLQQYPVMLHMVPGVLDLTFARTPVATLGGVPLISLRESALNEMQRVFKRLFDTVASAFLLLLLAPLMVIIALLIRIESPGPVFFRQERIGEHGRRFKMLKFRSMYQDAEQRWLEVARRDTNGRLVHKTNDDPRVTRIGRKLRRTSLDELPQLINVLRGEMSLVGPRPEMPYIALEYEPWQWQRFRVPPGITGWWQVNGRSDKPMHLHTEDDLYYIQNYSFWLDLRILLKTIIVVLHGHGAY
jgi:exopolysaccharide biosynthesis polyprenyl glycosylphosphotransferase